jgi:hypothetical protein
VAWGSHHSHILMKSLNFESISVTVESYCIYCNGGDGGGGGGDGHFPFLRLFRGEGGVSPPEVSLG